MWATGIYGAQNIALRCGNAKSDVVAEFTNLSRSASRPMHGPGRLSGRREQMQASAVTGGRR